MAMRGLESHFIRVLSPFQFGLGRNFEVFCARVLLLYHTFLFLAIIGIVVLVSFLFPWFLIVIIILPAIIIIWRRVFFKFGWYYLRTCKFLAGSIIAATLSLAQDLLNIFDMGDTIGRIKESLLQKMEAETKAVDADVQRKLEETAALDGMLTFLYGKLDTIDHYKLVKKDIEVKQQQIIIAMIRFLEAIKKLRQEGDFDIDPASIHKIVQAGLQLLEEDKDKKVKSGNNSA